MSLLEIRDLDKYYGEVKAVDNGRLFVDKGEVHALIGANGAGKSTLMKVLCGETDYSKGSIIFDGKEIKPIAGKTMMEMGIVMIHQEINVVSSLTVSQYMYLGKERVNKGIIDDHSIQIDAKNILNKLGADFEVNELMGNLSLAQQQLVEIAKALTFDLKLLILDEPTTALGYKETNKIYEIIRELKKQDIAIIFISHRLEELLEISDRISIMRDGKYIDTLKTKDTTKEELIKLLAGRTLNDTQKVKSNVCNDEVVLEVKNLNTSLLKDVSFKLYKGEILGLAGLSGSGRSETVRAICGIDHLISGEIYIRGIKKNINSTSSAVKQGICYLSEDRNKEGYIPNRSILANTVLSNLNNYQKGLFLDDKKMLRDALSYNETLKTKYNDIHSPITSLSGGNIQKVLIAKWMLRNPEIFIFDEPTKGIDIGSKDEIYQIINSLAQSGHSIILISSETKELLNNCDRLVVLSEGRVSGQMNIEDVTQEKLMAYSIRG